DDMEHAKEVVIGIRAIRAAKNIANKETLRLNVIAQWDGKSDAIIKKLGNLSGITANAEKDAAAASFMVGTTEFNIPLTDNIDINAELAKLNKDLEYYQGFLTSVQKKLSNERFVNNAPAAVVDAERRKQADAESKIKSLQESIEALSK
ncbi:MAG: valine--tRNA ligase, partial [Muribaculaceae bacterium]|nr:valine--tRNA ligase [Muribaculaceae bacterium]